MQTKRLRPPVLPQPKWWFQPFTLSRLSTHSPSGIMVWSLNGRCSCGLVCTFTQKTNWWLCCSTRWKEDSLPATLSTCSESWHSPNSSPYSAICSAGWALQSFPATWATSMEDGSCRSVARAAVVNKIKRRKTQKLACQSASKKRRKTPTEWNL